MSVKCVECGAELQQNMKFCTNCGCSVSAVEEPAAVKTPEPAPQVMKRERRGPTVGQVLLTFLLCLLILVLGIYSSVGLAVRHITGERSLTSLISEIDLAEIETGAITGHGDETLAELIHDQLQNSYKETISRKDIKRLLEEEFVAVFAAQQLSGYADDIFGDVGSGIIEADELEEFFEDNYKKINDALDCDFSKSSYRGAVKVVEILGIEEASDFSQVREENEAFFEIAAIVFSYPVLIGCAAVCVLFVLLILLVNRMRSGAFVSVGVCNLIVSLPHLAVFPLLMYSRGMLEEEAPLGSDFYDVVIGFVSRQELMVGGAFVLAFVLLVVLASIIKRVSRRKAAKAAA